MRCSAPLRLLNKESGLVREVACSRCRGCRIRRKMAWVGRLRLELRQHEAARFLTLTYAEDPGELQISDLQRFLKRYRWVYGETRYFAVGEYGGKTNRGHWHVLMFGQPPEAIGALIGFKPWQEGFVSDGWANTKSIGYVAGYVLKPAHKAFPNITSMSLKPGLGFTAIAKMGELAAASPLTEWPIAYNIEGRRYPLCGGGLAAFKVAYLESGGLPPAASNPEELHWKAYNRISMGSRIEEEKNARAQSYREVVDEYASHSLARKSSNT